MKVRAFLRTLVAVSAFACSAWADKIAVLPFSSPKNVPKPELEQAREWTQLAVQKKGHSFATPDEMVSAEAVVKDGVPDTSTEYIAAGKAVHAKWTLAARVERIDYPPNAAEDGYTTYRVELEACQVDTGRVESLSREILPGDSDAIAEMLTLLIRPEGIANSDIPWERAGVARPKPRPKPPAPREPEPPPTPPKPAEPEKPRPVYGAGHPLVLGAALGFSDAVVRPSQSSGSPAAMSLGALAGYALTEYVPNLELRANLTGQVVGPRALEVSAGARYAFAPTSAPFFVGPELLLGGFFALGGAKEGRFYVHPSIFAAYAVTENVQVEAAGDVGIAAGSDTLVLLGGTARAALRF